MALGAHRHPYKLLNSGKWGTLHAWHRIEYIAFIFTFRTLQSDGASFQIKSMCTDSVLIQHKTQFR